jgi:hypothetical protein
MSLVGRADVLRLERVNWRRGAAASLVGSGIGPPDSEESDEAPHRTGRAQLRHPVPRVMDSLRTVVMYLSWN